MFYSEAAGTPACTEPAGAAGGRCHVRAARRPPEAEVAGRRREGMVSDGGRGVEEREGEGGERKGRAGAPELPRGSASGEGRRCGRSCPQSAGLRPR